MPLILVACSNKDESVEEAAVEENEVEASEEVAEETEDKSQTGGKIYDDQDDAEEEKPEEYDGIYSEIIKPGAQNIERYATFMVTNIDSEEYGIPLDSITELHARQAALYRVDAIIFAQDASKQLNDEMITAVTQTTDKEYQVEGKFKIKPPGYELTEYDYSITINFLDFKPEEDRGALFYYTASDMEINDQRIDLPMFDEDTKE